VWRVREFPSKGYDVAKAEIAMAVSEDAHFQWPPGIDYVDLGTAIMMRDIFNMRDYGRIDDVAP